MKLTFSNVLILFSIASASAQQGTMFPTAAPPMGPSVTQCFPSNLPWVNFEGNDYIFSRMHYNSECVDDTNRQYEWGAIQGVNTGIEDVCASRCIQGYGRSEARGCSTSQRPDPKKLVGFNYDCDEATCYCLYERGTLSNRYNRCFDEMNTSNGGHGDVFQTTTKPGTTCYSLHIQPSDPPPAPEPRGQSICTRALDYECYKHGRPKCCEENDGKYRPSEMTICDNFPEGMGGTSYCTHSPSYGCFKDGWPSCCSGNFLNCPREKPGCEIITTPTPGPTSRPTSRPTRRPTSRPPKNAEPRRIENCNDRGIKTWNDCQSYCKNLSSNWRASYEGRSSSNIGSCECNYGKNRENNYKCKREFNEVLASQR